MRGIFSGHFFVLATTLLLFVTPPFFVLHHQKYVKYVRNLVSITASGDHCVLATRADDSSGQVISTKAPYCLTRFSYINVKPNFKTFILSFDLKPYKGVVGFRISQCT